MTGMTAAVRAAQILVVRAVEETRPDEVPPAALVDSFTIAGDLDDEVGWLWRPATFLLEQPPLARYRRLVSMATTGSAPISTAAIMAESPTPPRPITTT